MLELTLSFAFDCYFCFYACSFTHIDIYIKSSSSKFKAAGDDDAKDKSAAEKKRNQRIKKQAKPPASQNKWICRENVKMWMFAGTHTTSIYKREFRIVCLVGWLVGWLMEWEYEILSGLIPKRSIWIRKKMLFGIDVHSSRTHHSKCVKAHAHNTHRSHNRIEKKST